MTAPEILYEDKWIVVCIKPSGVLSEEFGRGRCMPQMLKEITRAYNIFVIHRLDKPVSGVMVFAKDRRAAADLSGQMANGEFNKEYLAVISGKPEPDSGDMTDYLFRDGKTNKSFVVKTLRKGAKEAKLSYENLGTAQTKDGTASLVKVRLHTGRTHQIRVQFASRKMPLLGDKKYGSSAECDIALRSNKLSFRHPVLNKPMEFTAPPLKSYPFNQFK